MLKTSLRRRLRYRFDNFMARGGSSIFISLILVFSTLVILLSAARGLVNQSGALAERPGDFWRNLYMVFIQLTDPGTLSYDIDSSIAFKAVAVLTGLAGVVVLSSLIAFITTALNSRLEKLKRGRSYIVEEGHTLILGWNERTVEVVRELILANESEANPVVVILSRTEKERMDDLIHLRLPDTKNTRVITRYGNTSLPTNLDRASLASAKSVIVLARASEGATEAQRQSSDAKVIKTCLAVEASRPAGRALNIVAELFTEKNRQVVRDISPGDFLAVDDHAILAKLIVQTSRSTGLSAVYSEILSFDGCEMYFYKHNWGSKNFGDLQFHFLDGVPIGIRDQAGKLFLNPPAKQILKDNDEILIVAQDDSSIRMEKKAVLVPRKIELSDKKLSHKVERALVLGWNPRAPILIEEFSNYVLDGSRIDVMIANASRDIKRPIQDLNQRLKGLQINLVDKDPLKPEALLSQDPFSYNNIILLSQGNSNGDPETTDSETIVVLLQLRRIFKDNPHGVKKTKIITEVLHSDNQALIARAGVNDFIISTQLVSMMLAQMSEEPRMHEVYEELFKEEGSEIYVKSANLYCDHWPAAVRFGDLMTLAQARGECCIGVKIHGFKNNLKANFGVELIPPKDKIFNFSKKDFLVVVAQDET